MHFVTGSDFFDGRMPVACHWLTRSWRYNYYWRWRFIRDDTSQVKLKTEFFAHEWLANYLYVLLTILRDVGSVIANLYPEISPPIILMGHSMGGAIAVHTLHHECITSVIGLIVIDVVEGTAVDALASMQSFLRSRPSSFKSVKEAISWRWIKWKILLEYNYIIKR